MKKNILVLMILTAITTNLIYSQTVGTLQFVSKWQNPFYATWATPGDCMLLVNDLTTIKNFINTNSPIVGGNNAFTGNNIFAGTSGFNGASTFASSVALTSTVTTSNQVIYSYLPDTFTTARTLKSYEVITTSINCTQGAGKAITLPLGSSIDTALGLVGNTAAGVFIDFIVNNVGGTGNDSLIANTGVTFGTYPVVYNSYATGTISTLVVAGQARHFELFRSGSGTYILYKRD